MTEYSCRYVYSKHKIPKDFFNDLNVRAMFTNVNDASFITPKVVREYVHMEFDNCMRMGKHMIEKKMQQAQGNPCMQLIHDG